MSALESRKDKSCLLGTKQFFAEIWGDEDGPHFIGTLENKIFKNHSVTNAHDAAKLAVTFSEKGIDAYFAMSEFADHSSRSATNAVGASAFWLDIDCGQEKYDKGAGYRTKKEANSALIKFCDDAGMPYPTHLIDSGNGLHGYWVFNRLIARTEWQATARKFKSLTVKHGLIADPTRTADIASVLRVPNTNNYKDKSNPKLVKLKYANPNISADTFVAAINASSESVGSDLTKLFKVEHLGVASAKDSEPYPFTPENAIELLSAAHVAYPNIQDEGEFAELGFICANLITHDGWPETEVRRIFDEVCLSASNAKTENNDTKWESFKTQSLIYTGEPRRVVSLFRDARDNGWKPTVDIVDSVIDQMNIKYAWIEAQASIYRLGYRDFINTEKFNNAYANQFTKDREGKQITLSRKWMVAANRRQHKGIVTRPDEPEITSDGYLNDWMGYAVSPAAGNIAPFKALYNYLFGDEPFPLKWLAHLVQRPGIKMFTSLVVWSTEEGVGKNLFFEGVQNLFYPQHGTVISQSEVEDDFTGWIAGTVFAIADEIKASRSDKVRDRLKTWCTATTLRTHDKGQPKRVIDNLLNMVFLSNHADGMHLTDADRRFFIWEVTAKPMPQFMIEEFVKWRDTGLPHLLHYLLSIDITGFDPKGRAPMTQAKFDMVEASRSDLERWCKDVVTGSISLGHEVTTAEKLLRSFCCEFPDMKTAPSISSVGKVVVKMGAFARKTQVRLTNGRKVRAIAVNRQDYWETQSESAWRVEIELKL